MFLPDYYIATFPSDLTVATARDAPVLSRWKSMKKRKNNQRKKAVLLEDESASQPEQNWIKIKIKMQMRKVFEERSR